MSVGLPSVLLVEEGWHPTLYVAHGLAAAGCRVTVLTANGTTARCRGRDGVEWRSGPRVDDPAFAAHVRGADVVLPLTEAAMLACWAHDLEIFPATTPLQRALIADKHTLVAHLSRVVPVPRHVALADAVAPVVVKGSTGSAGRRVRIAMTDAELSSAVARAMALDGTWIAQEYLAGPTWIVAGVFDGGRPVRLYAAEKCEQQPPRVGTASRLRTIADEDLVATATRAIAALGWTGFASVDLMRGADGRPVLIEVNPRPWGCIAAARAAGVELFAPIAQLLAGEHPTAELSYAHAAEHAVFPHYLRAPSLARLRAAVRDLRGEQGRHWREPRLALHTLRRLVALARQQPPRL